MINNDYFSYDSYSYSHEILVYFVCFKEGTYRQNSYTLLNARRNVSNVLANNLSPSTRYK